MWSGLHAVISLRVNGSMLYLGPHSTWSCVHTVLGSPPYSGLALSLATAFTIDEFLTTKVHGGMYRICKFMLAIYRPQFDKSKLFVKHVAKNATDRLSKLKHVKNMVNI